MRRHEVTDISTTASPRESADPTIPPDVPSWGDSAARSACDSLSSPAVSPQFQPDHVDNLEVVVVINGDFDREKYEPVPSQAVEPIDKIEGDEDTTPPSSPAPKQDDSAASSPKVMEGDETALVALAMSRQSSAASTTSTASASAIDVEGPSPPSSPVSSPASPHPLRARAARNRLLRCLLASPPRARGWTRWSSLCLWPCSGPPPISIA